MVSKVGASDSVPLQETSREVPTRKCSPAGLGASGEPDTLHLEKRGGPSSCGSRPEEAAKTGSTRNSASQRTPSMCRLQLKITPQTGTRKIAVLMKKKEKELIMCQLPITGIRRT